MTTAPVADQRILFGSTLIPLELAVQDFPFDPSDDGYTVTLQAVSPYTGAVALADVPAEVANPVQDPVTQRWSFGLATTDEAGFPGTDLAPGPWWVAFKIVDGEGRVGYVPASGRLLVEILPQAAGSG